MSETDEGSTGFEVVDVDSTVETKKALPVKPRKNAKSKGNVKAPRNDKTPTEPKETPKTQVPTMPSDVMTSPLESVQAVDANAEANPQTDSLVPSQLNADMVWSGLQWGASFLSKVTEKAKESVDKVITTLDPQMKPILFSGGDLTLIVASDNDDKVMPIQDAFWEVFGKATVDGIKAQPSSMAAQPVGFTAGLKAAEDRISRLKSSGEVNAEVPVIAVEGFLAELNTDQWFEMSCVFLEDKVNNINLTVYTQATPLSENWIEEIRTGTPSDYPLSWCGFATTIGEVASKSLSCKRNEWHEKHTGLPRSASIYQASRSLAYLYQERLRVKESTTPTSSSQTPVTTPTTFVGETYVSPH